MVNRIVTVNVATQVAPTPSTLQQTGALISQGGTTTAVNTLSFLTQLSDLTALLVTPKAITSMVWAGNVVTVTTTVAHGLTNAGVFTLAIAGVTPAAYNGTFSCTVTGTTTFTYPLTPNPGAVTVQGTWQPQSAIEVRQMATTFFAQGSSVGVYVLEFGIGTSAAGVTALTSFITANPNTIYSYLTPRSWGSETTYPTFLANYTSPTAKTYFFTTVTSANYTNFSGIDPKCLFLLVEAPAVPPLDNAASTEVTTASAFHVPLAYAPSSAQQVTPTAYSFLYGVTPWPPANNNSTLANYSSLDINYVATGAEGGLSTSVLYYGKLNDGNDFTYWYSVDWVQINCDTAISNAIINGSNNPQAPLYYNQAGINVLQSVVVATMKSAIGNGLALGILTQTTLPAAQFTANLEQGMYEGQVVVNAEPFLAYSNENPGDYAIGNYAGLSVAYTPARGFLTIVFNITVSNFVAI